MLVIFDCDGVLVDTEPMSNDILLEALAKEGLTLSYEEAREKFVGRSIESIQKMVENTLGRTLGDRWCDDIRSLTEKAFEEVGVDAIPGVRTQIERLIENNIPYCVASSGRIGKMHISLGQAGLLPLLKDVLFSATMVERGKPHPDLFLHAARQMGFEPKECVVIEDSLPGVQAAGAAGMRALAYIGDPASDATALQALGAELLTTMDELENRLALSAPA
ncbi:MAG: HAD family hydrolase [Stappiaceae bacterium]